MPSFVMAPVVHIPTTENIRSKAAAMPAFSLYNFFAIKNPDKTIRVPNMASKICPIILSSVKNEPPAIKRCIPGG